MAIRVQTEFTRQGTVRTIYYNYDDDQALADATSVAISIVNKAGTVVTRDGPPDANSRNCLATLQTERIK